MLPYHAGLRVKLGLQRLIGTEPLYNRVLPGWYIGGWPWSGSELPSDGPSVLDCTCELPRTHRHRYLCLPVWDTQAPPAALIEKGVAFALNEQALGKSVYVHCAHGHGRSALLLVACLLEGGLVDSLEEGLALLKAARPRVHLNRRQRQALEAWARSRGAGGRGAGGVLQMQPLPTAGGVVSAAAVAATPATPAGSATLAVMPGLSFSSAVHRRGSAGGASDGGGGGGGDADVGLRMHLLVDSRESTAVSVTQYGLELRLAATGSGVLQSAASLPLAESLRAAGSQIVAAATAAMEGGKKLS